MRGIIMTGLVLFLVCSSCNNDKEDKKEVTSENDVDAARNFIRSALDGNWREARRFMLQDSTNTQLLDTYENNYQVHMNKEDKRGYREASITLYDTREVNDSVAIINYSNSFKKQKDSLRVVRIDGTWMVDLKYSFPQTDTSAHAH
jgi:DTW domain-containing protein YfiP